jgi:hypothetical protein
MPVYRYLDISTACLTEREMNAVNDRLSELEHESPRVIVHEYGAWVNVPPQEWRSADSARELSEKYPNLASCIARAREFDCLWINFDRDANPDDALPTHEW